MAITTAQYEKISRFLDAEMDVVEMNDFEAELISNPEMAQQLSFELSVREAFALQPKTGINQPVGQPLTTGDFVTSPAIPARNSIPARKKLLAVAAAAIVITTVITLFFVQPSKRNHTAAGKTTPDTASVKSNTNPVPAVISSADSSKENDNIKLFNKYYVKDKLPDNYPLYLADALTRYEAGDYAVLQKLDLSAIPETRGNEGAEERNNIVELGDYYKGISYLETNHAAQAIACFERLLQPGRASAFIAAKARWFLALAYLKNQEPEKTAQLLRTATGDSVKTPFNKNEKALRLILEKRQ